MACQGQAEDKPTEVRKAIQPQAHQQVKQGPRYIQISTDQVKQAQETRDPTGHNDGPKTKKQESMHGHRLGPQTYTVQQARLACCEIRSLSLAGSSANQGFRV